MEDMVAKCPNLQKLSNVCLLVVTVTKAEILFCVYAGNLFGVSVCVCVFPW